MTLKLAIVGCGNISGPYSKDIKRHKELELLGYSDLDQTRAQAFATEHGGKAYASLEAVLADPSVEAIVNLTIHHAHYAVIKQALNAGKHVYSEKPLAMTYKEASELVALAKSKNLRLACAPITFLGEAQQAAMRLIRDGKIGTPRIAYAEVNHGRIESWHPNPAPFYQVGPLFDVGVYPITILTALFGPVRRVSAFAKILSPNRVTKDGTPFTLETPDFYVANLEFDNMLARLTANFYVTHKSKQGEYIEFHGDVGSLFLPDWHRFNTGLEYANFGEDFEAIHVTDSETHIDWARGLVDFAAALKDPNATPRVTGEQAAHVVEILEATAISAREEKPVKLVSSFTPPALM